jgi:hypothetical protein
VCPSRHDNSVQEMCEAAIEVSFNIADARG